MPEVDNNLPQDSNILSEAESMITQQPVSYDEVEVSFSTSSAVLQSYLDAQFSQYEATVSMSGGKLPFSKEVFIRYCATIVASRVNWAAGRKASVHPRSRTRVPAFLSTCLSSIGVVEIPEKGLRLVPVFKDEIEELTESEINRLSNQLSLLESRGFTFSEGFVADKVGSVQVMTMQVIENSVLSTSAEAHPIASVIAGTFAVQGLALILGEQAFRVQYAELSQLAQAVSRFTEPRYANG
jgi:hypothetical protein